MLAGEATWSSTRELRRDVGVDDGVEVVGEEQDRVHRSVQRSVEMRRRRGSPGALLAAALLAAAAAVAVADARTFFNLFTLLSSCTMY